MAFFHGILSNAPPRGSSVWEHGRYLLLAILVFSVPLGAQDPGQRPPPDMTGTSGRQILLSIEGRVVAENEGANLPGVHVTLTEFRGSIRGSYDTRSGGAFAFSNLPPGRYTLTFSHPDFAEQKQIVDIVFVSHQGMVVTLFRNNRGPSASGHRVPVWALQIPPKAQKEFNKGLEALERGNPKVSIVHLESAVRLYPRFAAAYGAMGAAYASAGDANAAATAFEKALEIDENLSAACLGLGTLYAAEQRYTEAEKYLLRARVHKPEDWHVHYQLGEVYWRTGDWAKAEESLSRAIALHGQLARMHLLLINVLAGQEKYPDILNAMENFLRLFPHDRFAAQVIQKRDLLRAEIAKQSTAKEGKQP